MASSRQTASGSRFNRDHFEWPDAKWMLFNVGLQSFILVPAFAPQWVPAYLDPVGSFMKSLYVSYPNLSWIYIFLAFGIIHPFEAYLARRICAKNQMTSSATNWWTLSTWLFGFTSLTYKLEPYVARNNPKTQ